MIDFPIAELLDDSMCLMWLERHRHPHGRVCPHGKHADRRVCRAHGHVPADRGRACEGDYPLWTGTMFEQTRQRPATLVLRHRGMATGEPTARLARELGLSRTPLHPRRRRLQATLNETASTAMLRGTACDADERSQHAGETKHAPSRSARSATPPRQQAPRARHLCH